MERREYGDRGLIEASALADASSAQLGGEQDADRLDDISKTLNGAQAITGRAIYSANQAARNSDPTADQKNDQKQHEDEERELKELAHLMAWNAEMTTLGGVQMTNEEAQRARKYIIDHDDECARRAIRDGRISENEADEYKQSIRRIYELEEKRGRGTLTRDEEREEERLRKSHAAQEAEKDAGRHFAEEKDHTLARDAKAEQSAAAMRDTRPAVADETVFRSAPAIDQHFVAANAATVPLDKKPDPAAPSRVATMGLSV